MAYSPKRMQIPMLLQCHLVWGCFPHLFSSRYYVHIFPDEGYPSPEQCCVERKNIHYHYISGVIRVYSNLLRCDKSASRVHDYVFSKVLRDKYLCARARTWEKPPPRIPKNMAHHNRVARAQPCVPSAHAPKNPMTHINNVA